MKKEPRNARHQGPQPMAHQGSLAIKLEVPMPMEDDSKPKNKFDALDGSHPWTQAVPDGYVLYPVRELENGKVTYFNYELAKEMGLLSATAPHSLTAELEQSLLKNFNIRIVNEYDAKTKRGAKNWKLKPKPFMATRYLQLQHDDKKGRTSGDGRSIWNGVFTHKGKTWDVSSRGTGVTCLSPGMVEAGKPLKTGGLSHGYGCGLADIDELYGSAMMSEIFHQQGIPTERMLCIIDIGNKLGIGVRAHTNLIRPAHLFRLLKLNDYANLRRATHYFIDRQVKNGDWQINLSLSNRYAKMSSYIAESFAKLAARLESDYIFVWLDWDGDNILADGSIIDYGSVRQFGLRHDQYRYDDVDRFSTNLNEQKQKAREIVQTFVQLSDYLQTGRKKPVNVFANSNACKKFDSVFKEEQEKLFLERVGFDKGEIQHLRTRYRDTFESFEETFRFFEAAKTSAKTTKVADGINRPAIYNMRDLLRELPKLLISSGGTLIEPDQMFDIMISSHANREDRKVSESVLNRLFDLQVLYLEMVECIRGRRSLNRQLTAMSARSSLFNRENRITGNAVTEVVDELMSSIKDGISRGEIQKIMDHFIADQTVGFGQINTTQKPPKLIKKLSVVVLQNREDI